jgi:hypothetical protein
VGPLVQPLLRRSDGTAVRITSGAPVERVEVLKRAAWDPVTE